MIGRRIESPFAADGALIGEWPQPGDYYHDAHIGWCACTPNGHLANLSRHQVEEHEDGTITVGPSILVSGKTVANPEAGILVTGGHSYAPLWHGFLERGVWRAA